MSTYETGELDRFEVGLRAPAAARLLHPVGRRRPRQRGRHHGPLGARGAPVQIRLGHRLQLLDACAAKARSCRAAVARRASMSFLKIGDRAAGAIKSGGTTRRAAKMVVVDVDHPDIEDYIDWKVSEEQKVAALVTGSQTICQKHLKAVMKACVNCEGDGDACFDATQEPGAEARHQGGPRDDVPKNYVLRVDPVRASRATPTSTSRSYDTDWDSEAYLTVSGQNSNNSVRVTDEFLQRGRDRRRLEARPARVNGKVAKTRARPSDLWEKIGYAAWASADPGIQFHTTINEWHTCPAAGPIRASNPCSEYMFLDDTACNLASLNLLHLPQARTAALRRRRLRAHLPPLDRGPRDLGDDGAVPVARDRRALLPTTARSASATPISAAC